MRTPDPCALYPDGRHRFRQTMWGKYVRRKNGYLVAITCDRCGRLQR